MADCTGRYDCCAECHTHGCYADYGVCDAPSEHFATRGSSVPAPPSVEQEAKDATK